MDKFSQIRRILIIVLVLNWLVAVSKVLYGLITKCASMTADGVHSFGDGTSNLIGLIGIWAASKPKDKDHPYGHKKFETFATLGIAVVLFLAAFEIFKEAIGRVFHPVTPEVTAVSFIIMFATMAINVMVMRYERDKGKKLSSDVLLCDSLHTRSDILASLVVIFTLVSVKMGFWFLDTAVAVFISALIAKSGIEILKRSSEVLCDASTGAESNIANIIKNIPGVKSVHHIRTRGRKDDIHVDLHVAVEGNMHIDDAHELSHKIENLLKKKIKGITDVIVHMEPSKK